RVSVTQNRQANRRTIEVYRDWVVGLVSTNHDTWLFTGWYAVAGLQRFEGGAHSGRTHRADGRVWHQHRGVSWHHVDQLARLFDLFVVLPDSWQVIRRENLVQQVEGDQLNAVRREVLLDLVGALRRSDSLSRQANTGWLEAVLRHIRVGPRRDVGDWGGGGRVGPQVIGGRVHLRRASEVDLRDEPVLVRL